MNINSKNPKTELGGVKVIHSGVIKYGPPDRKFFQSKRWRLYALVTPDGIVMFNDAEAVGKKKPDNMIKLNKFSSIVDEENHEKKKHTFAVKVYPKNKKGERSSEPVIHWFFPDDATLRTMWMSAIQEAIAQKKEGQIILHVQMIKKIEDGDTNGAMKWLHDGIYSKNASIQFSNMSDQGLSANLDDTDDIENDADDEPVSTISEKEKNQILDMGYVEGDTLLHIAAKNGNVKLVKSLLERKCDIFVRNSAGDTPLHLIFDKRNYMQNETNNNAKLEESTSLQKNSVPREEIAKLLLQTEQIPINTTNNEGYTPLALSCKNNDFVISSMFLNKDADPDICPKGESPLHYAVSHRNQKLLEMLLKKGAADPNIVDSQGYTPLDRAVQRFKEQGIVELVSTIFSESNPKVNVNHSDHELLKRYVYLFATNAEIFGKKGVRLLDSILESHPGYVLLEYKDEGIVEVPLIQAIKNKHIEVAQVILKYRIEEVVNKAEIREDGHEYYPLHVSIMNSLDAITEILLKNGANCVQKSGKEQALPMLYAAMYMMRDDLAELLIEKSVAGLDQEQQSVILNSAAQTGQTILYFAVQHSSLNFVKKVIEMGANMNSMTEKGETVLCAACSVGNLEAVKYFVEEKGFDPKGTGREYYIDNGYPPLHSAVKNGHLHIVKYLIEEKGVDINLHKHELHMRPIQLACLNGHLDVVKYLVEKGCDLNAKIKTRDDAGISCLHLAAGYGFPDVVSFLLDQGMDVMERTEGGASPLDFALRRHQLSVIKLLCDRGAVSDSVTLQLAVQTGSADVLSWVEAIQQKGATAAAALD
jgi:ankyrin repeat protein